MDEQDLFDDRLRAGLQRAVPHKPATPGAAAADLDSLRPRFIRARKRRTAGTAMASIAAAAVMVFGASALASTGGNPVRTQSIDFASDGSSTTVSTTVAPDRSGATTTVAPGIAETQLPEVGDPSAPTSTIAPAVSSGGNSVGGSASGSSNSSSNSSSGSSNGSSGSSSNSGGSRSGSTDSGTSSGSSPSRNTSRPSPTTTAVRRPSSPSTTSRPPTTARPTTTIAAGGSRTIGSSGGSISVRWTGSSVTLTGTSPAAGWSAVTEKNTGTRVKVKFRNGELESSVDVQIYGGSISVKVE